MSEQIEAAARKVTDLFESFGSPFTAPAGSPKAFAKSLDETHELTTERFNALSELAVFLNADEEPDNVAQGAAIDLFQCSGFLYLAIMKYSQNLPKFMQSAGYGSSVGRMPPVISKALKRVSFAMKSSIATDILFMLPHLSNLASKEAFEGRDQMLLDKALNQAIVRTDHAVSTLRTNENLDGYEMTEEDNALRMSCQRCTDLLSKLVKHSAKPQDLTKRIAEFQEFLS
ncbi:hypothetical protein PsAD2_03696 [Pseudovibrio axinellae]|uniref:Uncharacterized protein n=1 Tax=Pseudovibrio axinellae TaxID=989403 RepID=A0A165VTY8_9HYPH|nr:hypothetical protein [Pseudovibrio axinellae]KZL15440.1 hypothetical protein PsAD2_03696 [Pseudovibrio axinellae]SER56527.1 hypothetical protein SAMN05421798_11293 [Pseudovibrio axinellae]